MALTPGGLPYPVGTDKVVDGDDAIHALATAVDIRLNHGLYLTGTQAFGTINPGDTVVITLPALVLTEARDLFANVYAEGNCVAGAGTGFTFTLEDNGAALATYKHVWPSGTLNTNVSFALPILNAGAGSHVYRLRVTGYGVNGNALVTSRLTIIDGGNAVLAGGIIT